MKSCPRKGDDGASESRPARALWIEILHRYNKLCIQFVEAREGLVD